LKVRCDLIGRRVHEKWPSTLKLNAYTACLYTDVRRCAVSNAGRVCVVKKSETERPPCTVCVHLASVGATRYSQTVGALNYFNSSEVRSSMTSVLTLYRGPWFVVVYNIVTVTRWPKQRCREVGNYYYSFITQISSKHNKKYTYRQSQYCKNTKTTQDTTL